jgi:AAA domain-containing protein/bifunctional DNA primase/polymerase-like protein
MIAAPAGTRTDTLVFDDDSPNGDALEALARSKGEALPLTRQHRTLNGHRQYVFRHRNGIRNAVRHRGLPVDLRSEGGLIILPGSRAADGRAYSVLCYAPVAEPPEWLVQWARETEKVSNAGKRPRASGTRPSRSPSAALPPHEESVEEVGAYWYERALADAEPGLRNHVWFNTARQMFDSGMLSDEVEPYTERFVEAMDDADFTLTEALKAQDSAEKYERREPAGVVVTGRWEPEDSQVGSTSQPTEAIDGLSLWDEELPETQWAIPDVLPEGCTLLSGKPKAGKSYLALGLGLAVATGGKALGVIPCEHGRVLYLALEDNKKRLQKRMRELLGHQKPANLCIDFQLTWPRLDEGGLDALSAYLDEHPKTRLIMIDTFIKFRPQAHATSKYSYGDDYNDIAPLTALAHERHVAILVVHHSRKTQGEDSIDDASGTAGLTGAADAALSLRRVPSTRDAELKVDSRDIEEPRYLLERDEHSAWVLTGEMRDELSLNAKEREMRAFVEEHGPQCARAIWEAVCLPGDGPRERNTFDKRLAALVEKGVFVKLARGEYALAAPLESATSALNIDSEDSYVSDSDSSEDESEFLKSEIDPRTRADYEEGGDLDALTSEEIDEILRGADESTKAAQEAEAVTA